MAEKVKQYRHPDDPITLDELKGFLPDFVTQKTCIL